MMAEKPDTDGVKPIGCNTILLELKEIYMKKYFKSFIKQKIAPHQHWSHFEIILFKLFVKVELEERKHWPRFEIILFDQGRELYRDILSARNMIEASDMALAYAQVYYRDCNGIHVNSSFEMILFNEEKELYRGTLYAQNQSEASEMAHTYAQLHYRDCNRLHVNPAA